MNNEKLINDAKAIWGSICEPNWTKETLIELGQKLFARMPWEKLDQGTKLLFIRAGIAVERLNETPIETKLLVDKVIETKLLVDKVEEKTTVVEAPKVEVIPPKKNKNNREEAAT